MTKVPATYTCAQRGVWGPYHVLVPGPTTGRDGWGPTRDRGKDKTLCGIQLTGMWERDTSGIDPERIQCKRCRAILKKQGKLGKDSAESGGKMKLLTKELKQRIPPIHSTEGEEDPIVQAKFFDPCGSWTWFVLEGSALIRNTQGDLVYCPLSTFGVGPQVDVEFFGLVKGFANELGPFMLSELESVEGPFGLGIERDKFFTPKPLSEVWDEWPFE